MATQDKRKALGVFDRRLRLLKPSTERDPISNEEKVIDVVVYDNYPALRVDNPTGQNESQSSNLVSSQVRIEWVIRFIPNLEISTDWKVLDVYSKVLYRIIAPPIEVGFRQGYQLLTEISQ